MDTTIVSISSLTLDPTNARKHSEGNIRAIASSLRRFGQRKPIVVQGSKVLAGNGTLEAAKSIGWTEISIVKVPDEWDDQTAKAYALADNRSAELAEWDEAVLAQQLIELGDQGWDIADIGFEASVAEIRDIEDAFADVPTGERDDATQMTFTMTLVQAELIGHAIKESKKAHDFTDSDNKNSNGNALWAICQEWLDAIGQRDQG
jgi:ParB-like chromosome segregation protein Spo0J